MTTHFEESLQRDIVALRGQIAQLLDAEELRITLELHKEIRALREELAEMRSELETLRPPRDSIGL